MINRILKIEVSKENRDFFKSALMENQKKSQREGSCINLRIYEDNKNPNLFFTYERFIDKKSLETHLRQSYSQELEKLASNIEVLNLKETNPSPIALKEANIEDEEFVIFFIFKFKDGYKEKLLERFETHINETRKEKGNLLFDLFTIDEDENSLVVYEHWRNESDVWDIHFKQAYSEITGALMHEAVIGDLEQYMNFVKEIK